MPDHPHDTSPNNNADQPYNSGHDLCEYVHDLHRLQRARRLPKLTTTA